MMSLRNSLTGKVSVCILLLALAGCLAMPSTSWAILHVSCDAGEGDPGDGSSSDSDPLGGGSGLPPTSGDDQAETNGAIPPLDIVIEEFNSSFRFPFIIIPVINTNSFELTVVRTHWEVDR